mgnify:CR=1 FL=1
MNPKTEQENSADELCAAIKQLELSERGHAAAVDFRKLIANGGGGLDSANWKAVETLCRACRMGEGYTAYRIKDALPSR